MQPRDVKEQKQRVKCFVCSKVYTLKRHFKTHLQSSQEIQAPEKNSSAIFVH